MQRSYLSERDTKAIKLLKQGVPPRDAMRKVGFPPSIVKNAEETFLAKPEVKEAVEQFREGLKAAIPDATIYTKMQEWLEAKKLTNSHTEPDVEVPDYQTQLKAGELVMKAQKYLTSDTTVNNLTQINIENVLE